VGSGRAEAVDDHLVLVLVHGDGAKKKKSCREGYA
jgi:hypothetical protein